MMPESLWHMLRLMNVEQLMSRDVVTVSQETSLKDVAALLSSHGISGVPVCDAAGQVLGVVSEADILLKVEGPRSRRGHVLLALPAR
jgi:CBS domain-containing protein